MNNRRHLKPRTIQKSATLGLDTVMTIVTPAAIIVIDTRHHNHAWKPVVKVMVAAAPHSEEMGLLEVIKPRSDQLHVSVADGGKELEAWKYLQAMRRSSAVWGLGIDCGTDVWEIVRQQEEEKENA